MPDTGTILVVEDDLSVATVMLAVLGQAGHQAVHAPRAEAALKILDARPVDVVLTDLKMPGMNGMALLAEITARWPGIPVVMVTAHGTVPVAVEAMKAGAADFVRKPFEREELVFVVDKALAQARHAEAKPARPAAAPPAAHPFVGASEAMEACLALLRKAAPSDATVLLGGETGTGKSLAARVLHDLSPRRERPFVTVHCGALPETLLESELFGHEQGAFTGAVAAKPGRVALAEGGTLFLDEIGEVPLSVQVKLLRLLQERTYEPLGSTVTKTADVRFVAATHRDLPAMVQGGAFREDLYYRLNVVPVVIPPLSARPGEVAALARHFCARAAAATGREVTLDDAAVAALAAAPWPGNVRQLENLVERLVVLSDGETLGAEDVVRALGRGPGLTPAAGEAAGGGGDAPGDDATLAAHVRVAERAALVKALQRAKDNRTLAARLLGVSRRTLYNKLAEHGLE